MKITLWIMLNTLLFCNPLFAVEIKRTDLEFYRPFESVAKQVTPKAQQVLQGNCNLPSEVDHRNDAWQCQANNQHYDPCFVKTPGGKQQLICPEAPWSLQAVDISVKHSLIGNYSALDMSQDFPWAIQLSDGSRCLFIKNSNMNIAGQIVRYSCQNKSVLVGEIQRCKPVWKILHSAGVNQNLSLRDISVAWF